MWRSWFGASYKGISRLAWHCSASSIFRVRAFQVYAALVSEVFAAELNLNRRDIATQCYAFDWARAVEPAPKGPTYAVLAAITLGRRFGMTLTLVA